MTAPSSDPQPVGPPDQSNPAAGHEPGRTPQPVTRPSEPAAQPSQPTAVAPQQAGNVPQPAGYVAPPAGYLPPQQAGYLWQPAPYGAQPHQAYPMSGFAVPPPPMSPAGAPLASFGDRFLAYLVDYLLLTAIGMVIAVPAFLVYFTVIAPDMFFNESKLESEPLTFILHILVLDAVIITLQLIAMYVYHVEYMRRSGQTIGKKVMKLKVVPIDPAATLSRQECFRRFLVQCVGGTFVPFLSYIDGLWQLWDKPYQQCLHDKFARTVVVKVPAS